MDLPLLLRVVAMINPITAPNGGIYWRYERPQHSGKCLLLTIGRVAIIGNWSGDYGQHFVAWSPLPQRDKNQEISLGVLEL